MLWVWILIMGRCTTLCDKVCHWLLTGQWFSPGPPVSSTNKTDRHDITEILLKVAFNIITLTLPRFLCWVKYLEIFYIFVWMYSVSFSKMTKSTFVHKNWRFFLKFRFKQMEILKFRQIMLKTQHKKVCRRIN